MKPVRLYDLMSDGIACIFTSVHCEGKLNLEIVQLLHQKSLISVVTCIPKGRHAKLAHYSTLDALFQIACKTFFVLCVYCERLRSFVCRGHKCVSSPK